MRVKDKQKQDAIIKATVKLVNEIGFVSSSVSKIAKEAGVSPATIYIYYKNKEDLLVSTYVDIKKEMSKSILRDFNDSLPIRDIFRSFWKNAFDYTSQYPEYFKFTEQFSNSPFSELVDRSEVDKYFEPMFMTISKGIEQKIIKDIPFDILAVFMFYPVMLISNPKLCKNIKLNEDTIETAFTLAWDAIKL